MLHDAHTPCAVCNLPAHLHWDGQRITLLEKTGE